MCAGTVTYACALCNVHACTIICLSILCNACVWFSVTRLHVYNAMFVYLHHETCMRACMLFNVHVQLRAHVYRAICLYICTCKTDVCTVTHVRTVTAYVLVCI